MGYAERANTAAGLPRLLATRLSGLRVAVDVQHLYKPVPHDHDRGTIFTLADGTKVAEAQISTLYAQALIMWLHARGAVVLPNAPSTGILIGTYTRRNLEANRWGADAYLACHVNAGNGAYCLNEYAAGTPGGALALAIGLALKDDFKELWDHRELPLVSGQRGHVCIGEFDRSRPAVIVEPFFGDNPTHQGLIPAARLVQVGEAIGEGVAKWWERSKA
jgi:hypothetical protein